MKAWNYITIQRRFEGISFIEHEKSDKFQFFWTEIAKIQQKK